MTAATLAAAVALTSLDLAPASAASATDKTQAAKISTIDLSARRRHLRRGDALMLGAVASVFGAIAATAAAHRYRERYYYYGEPYDEGPYYYGGYAAPYAYAAPSFNGPGFRFHGHHGGHHGHNGPHGHHHN
jgi:hypothetical protein